GWRDGRHRRPHPPRPGQSRQRERRTRIGAGPRRRFPRALDPPMNISSFFIKRPITPTLIMLGIIVFGAMAYQQLPVSDLPTIDFPTIQGHASLPGASPATLAR